MTVTDPENITQIDRSALDTRDEGVAAAIDLAVSSVEPHAITNGRFVVVTPPGSTAALLDTRVLDPNIDDRPARKSGTVQLDTIDALALYVNAHKTAATSLYASLSGARVVAVINDHERRNDLAQAGWGDFRAEVALKHTPSWTRWASRNNKMLSQIEFAELVEEGRNDVINPLAADLLEMAQTFSATTTADFRSATRLQNGQRQFTYNEVIDGRAGPSGNMTIPETFTLSLAVYEGGDPVTFDARLRYRLAEGRLALGFLLDPIDEIKRDAFDSLIGTLTDATSIVPYAGTAPPLPDSVSV